MKKYQRKKNIKEKTTNNSDVDISKQKLDYNEHLHCPKCKSPYVSKASSNATRSLRKANNIPEPRKNHLYLCEECRSIFDERSAAKPGENPFDEYEEFDDDGFTKSDIYDS